MRLTATDVTMLAERQPGPGTRLSGIYEIDTLIATGGMGEVYRGRALETGGQVAIKMIRRDLAENERVLALFRKEAAALARLQHEAIVRYYVFTTDPDLQRPYLAMEFVEGEPLLDIAKRRPFAPEAVQVLMGRLAAGLQAAHEAGVIHRDVSPDNIILPNGDPARAKIIDFGIARSALDGSTVIGSDFAGKANFVSPEQIGLFGGEITAKSDIYGLGLTLAAALLGHPLDMAGTHVEVVAKRQEEPDLSGIDPRLRPILRAMLQPRPEDRPSGMAEIAAWQPVVFPATDHQSFRQRSLSVISGRPALQRRILVPGIVATGLSLAGLAAWQAGLLPGLQAAPATSSAQPVAATAPPAPPPVTASAPNQMRGSDNALAVAAERPRPAESADAARPGPETDPVPGSKAAASNPVEPRTAGAVEVPASADPRAFRDCATICPEMVRIPDGTFTMGSSLDPTERPARKVAIKAFALSRHPVTVQEWKACVRDGKCAPAAEGADDTPVHNVSWSDAQDYVAWLSAATGTKYRLPSEAEWEYAARAGTTTRYWWGDAFRANYADCRRCGPASISPGAIGRYPANPFGLHEITGSVSQWVADCWIPSFRGAPSDGSARAKEGCRDRVLRGGSWMMDPDGLRVGSRAFYDATVRYTGNGLRVASRL